MEAPFRRRRSQLGEAHEVLLDWYKGTEMLDTDFYHVGHHGSHNATTTDLLLAVTPELAVISCGPWDFGKGTSGNFTTYAYGHPRRDTLNLLSMSIAGERQPPVTLKAAHRVRDFDDYEVKKRIYATPWDGNIRVHATLQGVSTIAVAQHYP